MLHDYKRYKVWFHVVPVRLYSRQDNFKFKEIEILQNPKNAWKHIKLALCDFVQNSVSGCPDSATAGPVDKFTTKTYRNWCICICKHVYLLLLYIYIISNVWSACFLPGPGTVLFKSMPASKLHECWISNQHHSHLLKWDGRQLPAGREAWALMPRGPYSSLLLKTLKSVKWSACFLPGPDTVLFKSMPASKLHECWISNQHHSQS